MQQKKLRENQIDISRVYKEEIMDKLRLHKNGIYYTPKDAADVAKDILDIARDSGVYNGQATPVVKIIEAFGIKLYRTRRMLSGVSGVIYSGGRTEKVYKHETVIFTDDTEPYGHQRFVAVHELAHYLFDFIGNPDKPSPDYAFVENYPRDNHSSDKETRADRFAAALLMPNKLFRDQYNIAMRESNNRIYTVKYLAGYFQVKESSVERRIDEVLYYGGY